MVNTYMYNHQPDYLAITRDVVEQRPCEEHLGRLVAQIREAYVERVAAAIIGVQPMSAPVSFLTRYAHVITTPQELIDHVAQLLPVKPMNYTEMLNAGCAPCTSHGAVWIKRVEE